MIQKYAEHRRRVPRISSALIRLCSLAGTLGGGLFAIWGYVHRDGEPAYLAVLASTLALVVPPLFLAGLVGFYARYRRGMGRFGFAGFLVGFAGCARGVFNGVVGKSSWYLYTSGYGWLAPLLDWIFLLFAGLTLIGISTIRRGTLKSWSPLPLVTGLFGWVYYFTDSGGAGGIRAVHIVSGILFSLSWAVFNLLLFLEERRQTRRVSRESSLRDHRTLLR